MSTRQSRSASIPIPPTSSVARSLESVIPMSFNPGPAPRPRLVNAGTSASLSLARTIPPPTRSVSTSYASAISAAPRGRTSGPAHSAPAPIFEPRVIRATTSPNPSRDQACNPPYSPSTSPIRTRRLSSGVRSQASLSSSVPTHRAPAPTHATHTSSHGFPRPAYLEYSALRDMLHTEPSHSAHVASTRPPSYIGHDARATASPAPPVIPYPYLRRDLTPADSDDDEFSIATPPPPAVGAVTMISTNTVLMLPTRWSEQDRLPSLSVSLDGRELTFTGPPCIGDRESSAARANHAIPPACGIYYYEVEIVHKCPKGPISIGFSGPEVKLSRLPGWEKNSWGYHADDGCAFPGHKDGSGYGPTFDTGDVIGCGIDFSQNRVFYTKNGSFLGMVFENVGKACEIYPSIGMRQTNESIRANFGGAQFKFAIEEHIRAQRDVVWGNIMNTRIDWSLLGLGPRNAEEERERMAVEAKVAEKETLEDEESRAPLRKLVLAYLAHHGYARTARAFQKQCADRARAASERASNQPQPEPVDEDVRMAVDDAPAVASAPGVSSADRDDEDFGFDHELNTRLSITNAILKGDIDSALSLIYAHHSTVLECEQGLILFRLRCRKFVELVLEAGEALRRVKEAEATPKPAVSTLALDGEDVVGTMDGVGAMDVDDPSPEALPSSSEPRSSSLSTATPAQSHITPAPLALSLSAPAPSAPSGPTHPDSASSSSPSPTSTPVQTTHAALSAFARASLQTALQYGQTLDTDYKNDTRAGVRAHLRRTFGVVAFDDPVAKGGEVAETAGQAARNALAAEVNQAILESQGRPAHPALETLFRQAGAFVTQLGLLGVGAAAFADVRKEFIEG